MGRDTLLPESLVSPPWLSMMDAIDAVWKSPIDDKVESLRKVRFSADCTSTSSVKSQLEVTTLFDRETLVKKLDRLGIRMQASSDVSTASLHRLASTIGQYWFDNGNPDLVKYIQYVFNVRIRIKFMYSDFTQMLEEGNTGITSLKHVDLDGVWYKTPRLNLYIQESSLLEISRHSLLKFIDTILPLNLSLYRVIME